MFVLNSYFCSVPDDMGVEQHNTEDLVEFLLKRPETEDSGGIDSEPEAETLAMSCYHGSRSSGSANPPVRSSPEPDQRNDKYVDKKFKIMNRVDSVDIGSQRMQKLSLHELSGFFFSLFFL